MTLLSLPRKSSRSPPQSTLTPHTMSLPQFPSLDTPLLPLLPDTLLPLPSLPSTKFTTELKSEDWLCIQRQLPDTRNILLSAVSMGLNFTRTTSKIIFMIHSC